MCGVPYEGLPGRLWACYSCQLMSDTLLTDLSIHIHHNTLGQDILRCTNLGSLTEKRPRKVGYMLFVAGNSSITPWGCIVYIVCSLCTFFSLVSAMFSFLSYMVRPLGRWCWWHGTVTASPWRWELLTQHVCAVKMPCWMAPRHLVAAIPDCTVSHLHAVPTTGWADLYERSRLHPPFTALVWRFPHRCVLDGPSIEPGLAALAWPCPVSSSTLPPLPKKTFQNDRTKISTQTNVCPYQIRLSKCLNLPNFYIPIWSCPFLYSHTSVLINLYDIMPSTPTPPTFTLLLFLDPLIFPVEFFVIFG